jgi:hypothetical protein
MDRGPVSHRARECGGNPGTQVGFEVLSLVIGSGLIRLSRVSPFPRRPVPQCLRPDLEIAPIAQQAATLIDMRRH